MAETSFLAGYSFNTPQKQRAMKRCFVIGPMNPDHLPKLHWLANEVVAKILEPKGFVVFTPDVQQIGNIMKHVIRSADRADLVIADTTGNNPNVLYEIAILDALGKACVPIKQLKDEVEEKGERELSILASKDEKMAFDRAMYRYFCFRENDTGQALATLKPVIESILNREEMAEMPENPLTDFFQAPLSSMAPARGLVAGYFKNFILPALKGDIIKAPPFVNPAERLDLEIIIPEKVRHANRDRIEKLSELNIIYPIILTGEGRKVNAFVWNPQYTEQGRAVMVDIPTSLSQLTENIRMRLGNENLNPNSEEYKWLERDEVNQFVHHLLRSRDKSMDDLDVESRLQIVRVDQCRKPDLFPTR